MSRDMTLSQAVTGSTSLLKQVLMVAGGTAFIALAAQISVPMLPVPMTLQTLAILMVGFTFGARLGAATLIAYLAEGAMGLPVFANGMNGVAFAGPTAGFLVGFVGMSWAAGWAAERGLARGFVGTALSAIVISALLYVPGLAWPALVADPIASPPRAERPSEIRATLPRSSSRPATISAIRAGRSCRTRRRR